MDLKSILIDSAPRKPPQSPPHTNTEHHLHTPVRKGSSFYAPESGLKERPTPYAPPLQPPEPRGGGGGGSYFAQSPYQNNSASTSTWSAGAHSQHSQSPGTNPLPQTPRDGLPQTPYSQPFVPSPSSFSQHPPTPGVFSYQQNPIPSASHQNIPATPSYLSQSHSREPSHGPNGLPITHPQAVPHTNSAHPPPVTPLGPPASFQRPSPQSQRPPSQSGEHYRTYSSGSIGSSHSRETISAHITSPQRLRKESLQRQYSVERERSVSVSPKTIPRPSPLRQLSSDSRRQSLVTPMSYQRSEPEQIAAQPPQSLDMPPDALRATTTPRSSSHTPKEAQATPQTASPGPSPALATGQISTTKYNESTLSASQSPQVSKGTTLKRTASFISGASLTSQPVRKRPRRDQIPLYAQSARPADRPVRLHKALGAAAGVSVVNRPHDSVNGHVRSNGSSVTPQSHPQALPEALQPVGDEPLWEVTITNILPYEDLTRRVSDWIYENIGLGAPPAGGAVFEIEAKVGQIWDIEEGARVRLPVSTEAIFNKDNWRRTKFESTMNMEQHRQLNDFLNNLTAERHVELQTSNRHPILFEHLRESDEFFELSPAGVANLPSSITRYLKSRFPPRVRKTFDLKTHQFKTQIIKSRIADLEVFNPGSDFDYRISISIESPWNGKDEWLTATSEGGNDRNKDRMSYRHMAYQVDLTQVRHNDGKPMDHELEVEISTEYIRRELDNLSHHRPSKYEEVIKGFIDNVRILCRRATIPKG